MKKIGKFKILSSFKLTGRGLVVLGDILEGKVKTGYSITFNTGERDVTMKINGVDFSDNVSTDKSHVGLTFIYKNEEERKEFETLKLKEQFADILNTD